LIKVIYHEHKGRYGYRRIHLELRRQGFMLNHKTVQRLMGLLNLKSTVRIKKYRSYRGEFGKIAPNVLERDFSASKPDEKWVTDVTEFKVKDQKVYLSPIVDLFTQEVIAYNIAKNACLPLVTDMLTEAISKLELSSRPIIHSDQGWQYQHRAYQQKITDSGLTQSMSRKGNCLDNAVAENFFALLKTEMYHNQHFKDADALIEQIKEYIEYYNTKRIKVKLKGLTPIEYRNQALKAA
jgi:putative transposase